jgi:uncharacterized protein (UPF0333 family)
MKKKAQTMAEYAILIALVITAVVAMRLYVVRALQGRIHDAANQLTDNTTQYEPYYLESSYNVTSKETQQEEYSKGVITRITKEGETETRREAGGYQLYKAPKEKSEQTE